jgi:glycosyltransferase involved in cell wall biosynthesis
MNRKMVFIAWIAYSRRSQVIAEKLGMKLYLVHALKRLYILAPVRYLLQSIQTLAILWRERPAVTFVQNPPIFAPLVVYLYTRLTGSQFIIDAHSGALLAPWWRWSLPIHAFLSRRALATIVTNEHLAEMVKGWRARSFQLADVPTSFPQGTAFAPEGEFSVAVINTFAPDEPVDEVLKAAASLPEVHFYITGNLLRAKQEHLDNHPANVHFTGFLPDDEYIGLLRSVDAIMVLTKNNHTMQRGACEALWLGKPIITSDWPILRSYFHRGTMYVNNTADGIRQGILAMRQARPTMEEQISRLQQERRQEWSSLYRELTELLEGGPSRQRWAQSNEEEVGVSETSAD